MKKALLLILILLTGCTKTIEIKGEITEIKYNNIIIQKEDYQTIKDNLNTTYQNKKTTNLKDKLTIKTKEDIYYFTLSDKYIQINNYTKENTKLNKQLKKLEKKYINSDIYTIDYLKNYNPKETDTNIYLDKTSNYIIIKFKEDAKNFKINAIETINKKEYKDIDLLYTLETIEKNSTIIIRKSINYQNPDIRISFNNKYNYNISIIPTYDDNQNPKFETKFQNKNS